ncbi:MAG: hypothetical protein Q8R76_03630 [Candidatus Omnitrophota bacterium]|nr:hypothetical protein [Candidatus Omnitrophota bacterium]
MKKRAGLIILAAVIYLSGCASGLEELDLVSRKDVSSQRAAEETLPVE